MRMREYAYEDYGLVLDKPTMEHIFVKRFNEPIGDEDAGYALYDAEVCTCACQFTGEAFNIEDNGNDSWYDTIAYASDEIYYVPFNKYPSLFKASYKDINDIVEEFKEKLGEYMPENYNYRANIKHIIGTVWG